MRNVLQPGCQSDENAKDFEFSQCPVVRRDQCGVSPRSRKPLTVARSYWRQRRKQENRGGAQGSVAREWLPRADQTVFDKAPGCQWTKPMSKKILVVDDESSIREALSKVLQAEGYEVATADNGQQAIEKFRSERIDLVLLDLGLPVKDGRDTMIWLGEVDPLLPIIIITGRSNQRELAEKMGADALMDKPLDVPRLLQTVRALTDAPMECRAKQAKEHSSFRYMTCDHELFVESMNDRFTTPYKFPEPKNH